MPTSNQQNQSNNSIKVAPSRPRAPKQSLTQFRDQLKNLRSSDLRPSKQQGGEGFNYYFEHRVALGRYLGDDSKIFIPELDAKGYSKPEKRSCLVNVSPENVALLNECEQILKDFMIEHGMPNSTDGQFNRKVSIELLNEFWRSFMIPPKNDSYQPSLTTKICPIDGTQDCTRVYLRKEVNGKHVIAPADRSTFDIPLMQRIPGDLILTVWMYYNTGQSKMSLTFTVSEMVIDPSKISDDKPESSFEYENTEIDQNETPFVPDDGPVATVDSSGTDGGVMSSVTQPSRQQTPTPGEIDTGNVKSEPPTSADGHISSTGEVGVGSPKRKNGTADGDALPTGDFGVRSPKRQKN